MNSASRLLRSAGVLMVAAGIAGLAAVCPAQKICPWMNVATASGFLGGPADVTVNLTSESTGTCTFRLLSGTANDNLTISVAQAQDGEKDFASYQRRCSSSAVPLKAIGNEAVMCADTAAAPHGEQVIGRVRDSIFMVAISSEANSSRGTDNNSPAEKVKAIAEQVAGNLF